MALSHKASPRGTPVPELSAGAWPKIQIVAAVTAAKQTIAVPSGALFVAIKCATASHFHGSEATYSATNFAVLTAATFFDLLIPVSGVSNLYITEASGGAGVGATTCVWEMGADTL